MLTDVSKVLAFNTDRADGLIGGKAPGARPRLNADHHAER